MHAIKDGSPDCIPKPGSHARIVAPLDLQATIKKLRTPRFTRADEVHSRRSKTQDFRLSHSYKPWKHSPPFSKSCSSLKPCRAQPFKTRSIPMASVRAYF